MDRLKRLALPLSAVLGLVLLAGCAQQGAGHAFPVCVGPGFTTLDPIYAEDISSQTTLVHLYENLMRVAWDGADGSTVVEGMAKKVDVEENLDGTVTYTFHLRSAKWSDGKAVRAADFVYAWRRLADPTSYSPYAALLSVVCGYQEARIAGDMSLLQVTARNNDTLVVTLSGNYDWFLKEVCTSPATMPLREDVVRALKEAGAQAAEEGGEVLSWWTDPSALVTNGPYVATAYEEEVSLRLSTNERYYDDSAGPEELVFHFAETAEEAQALYAAKTVDAVWPLTEERLTELAADESWAPIPQLGTYAVVYNCVQGPFVDPLIRQALTLAVDRNALSELAGVTALAAEGLVPFGVPENEEGDFRTLGGSLLDNDPDLYSENCEQARLLLHGAGYSGGADLGELEYLYVDEGTNAVVAQALCQQWKDVLGIRVTPRGVSLWDLWGVLRSGEYTFAGVDLDAPGNDAECFLMDWTSDSQDNVVGYTNSAYDTLMAIIASTADGTARMGCLHDAEALLLGDYALAPLYTRGTDWELRETYLGACRDARGWFCFSGVITRPV